MKEVVVLGPGCAKCKQLAENAKTAISGLEEKIDFRYETDIMKIMTYGVVMTPGFAIDGKVISSGKVLSVEEIKDLIKT